VIRVLSFFGVYINHSIKIIFLGSRMEIRRIALLIF